MRKTIAIGTIQKMVNDMLRDSVDDMAEGRVSLAVLLERILMETSNYQGFCFTDGANGERDPSRRAYYYSTATVPKN